MSIVVAVATHDDGQGYVVRAERRPGDPVVVWRVAHGLCEGREFVSVLASGGDGDVVVDLQVALGADWSVYPSWEVADDGAAAAKGGAA